jgi:hypothetical protein
MSGSEEQLARSRLRASHADREQVIGLLKVAFVQGRLTKDEFDGRVDHAFAARTYAELTRLTEDLPVAPAIPVAARPRPASASPQPASASPQPASAPRLAHAHAHAQAQAQAQARTRPLADAEVQAGGKVIAHAAVIAVLLWVAAIVTFNGAMFIAALGATGTAVVASALTGGRLLGLWLDQLRGPRLPPRPAIGADGRR